MSSGIQFEGYFKSYLNNYLERKKIEEKLDIEFYDHLLSQILNIAAKTILTLFYAFKKENLLKGNTPKERYDYFDAYSKTDEFHNLVDKIYPLLSIRLDKMIDNHVINYTNLKERAEKDKMELLNKFGFEITCLGDCHIEYGISDFHRGLKSICIIENKNKKIVYKPRSGIIDIHWEKLLSWFNSKNPSLKLNPTKILNKGVYHWQEYVENNPCKSRSEIKNLYYRIGILSSISYVLKVGDLHMENIIVNGEFPYLVDLETIFQADGFQNGDLKAKSATDILNIEIKQSVLSTQMFPTPNKFYNSTVDISGITGRGGQIIKDGKIKIINQFTDEIKAIKVDNITKNKNNIGRIGNHFINPKYYSKDIVEGFREGYMLIYDNKQELLRLINSDGLFNNIFHRHLFRNTNLYAIILEMSKNPKYLKDRSDLDRLYNLLVNKNKLHKFRDVYQSELTDLFNDDIPYFYGRSNDKIIYNSNGDNCFELSRTPLIEVNQIINNLNKKDMYTQIDFIIKSMSNQKKTWNSVREKIDYGMAKNINTENSLVEAAKNIGNLLISKAIIHEETKTISWLDIQNTFPTWTIRAQDTFLYSGLTGNAIFFSSLYLVTKDIKYKNTLEMILNTIKIDLHRINNRPISAFNGIISLAYLYAFLYNQVKEKNMLQSSVDIISQNKEMILQNTSYDIIDGLSGILIVILNVYELCKDKELKELSIEIGQDIVKNIQIEKDAAYWKKDSGNELMIAGFSHGLAGVTYALGKLYEITDYKKYKSLINDLVKIENSYYSDEIENWIDLRSVDKLELNNSPIHWCHGATGIGLSRLKINNIVDTSDDMDKAINTVIKNGLYRDSDCLCHGNMGNMEFLLQVFIESQDITLYNKIIKRTNEIIIENEYRKGYINGIGQEFHSASFMLGLSGIGYEMIRLSEPEKHPSVLLLEV